MFAKQQMLIRNKFENLCETNDNIEELQKYYDTNKNQINIFANDNSVYINACLSANLNSLKWLQNISNKKFDTFENNNKAIKQICFNISLDTMCYKSNKKNKNNKTEKYYEILN